MRLIKRLIFVVVGLVVLLVAAVALAIVFANSIARKGIETGATLALGVKTTLREADVGLLSGRFGLSGLDVANPQGFKSPHFLALGRGEVSVSLASLNSPTVDIPSFALSDLDVSLERKGDGANYTAILDNLKRAQDAAGGSADPKAPKPAPSGEGKKFVIQNLVLRNIKIHADLVGGPIGDAAKVTVPIDEIRLENVGKTGTGVGGTGVTMGQLTSIIVQAVLAAATEKGAGIIPGAILGELQGGLAGLDGLKNIPMKALGDVKGAVEKAGQDAEKAVKQGLDDVKKGIENIIPGKK